MSKALDEVIRLLDLEQIEQDVFRGQSPEGERRQRVFGGQVAGQALVAAGRTVPADRAVHSLHAYFIRPGDPSVPLLYIVERVRDGRSFTTRRVSTVQHGKTIFTLSASFHQGEPGFEHADTMPEVPGPEDVEPTADRLRRLRGQTAEEYSSRGPIDIRYVGPLTAEAALDRSLISARSVVWLRADGDLPADPLLHVCLMTYASDMTLLDTVLLAQGVSWSDLVAGASLDHAMWFHRPFRADQWLLYVQDSPIASGGRGLARGEVYTREGELVVSVVQEGLLRPRGRRS
jgi:acyl-CoA thioesterase II